MPLLRRCGNVDYIVNPNLAGGSVGWTGELGNFNFQSRPPPIHRRRSRLKADFNMSGPYVRRLASEGIRSDQLAHFG